ncbi:MAG: hypothetical protein FWG25_02720 [Promicromonosporaceae bacterium]|nr:hypothetical protein [Promicromonosporaceae bacterium]
MGSASGLLLCPNCGWATDYATGRRWECLPLHAPAPYDVERPDHIQAVRSFFGVPHKGWRKLLAQGGE